MYNLYEMLVEYCSYVQHSIEEADVTYTLVGKVHTVDIGIVTRPDRIAKSLNIFQFLHFGARYGRY